MIFWDTSAIIPLLVNEPCSDTARRLARTDAAFVVWWGTWIECLSALARREHDGTLTRGEADSGRQALAALRSCWAEILASEEVREHAARLLLRHRLRAADAFQLGAALTWAQGRPDGRRLAVLDDRLNNAARGEGFVVGIDIP